MPNNFFKFKQFIIHQEHCAMKVCTDACLFGSILAAKSETNGVHIQHALDIGAGTGLLSLMYAQKNSDASIDAVEVDENAAGQASENIAKSLWNNRIIIINGNVITTPLPQKKYDLIFSNPPFFENDLKSENHQRNIALHSSHLSLSELFFISENHLSENGIFAVLLPYHRTVEAEDLCKKMNLFVSNKITVCQTPKHNEFRSILLMSRIEKAIKTEKIIIRDDAGKYSPEFEGYLKDYYLKL